MSKFYNSPILDKKKKQVIYEVKSINVRNEIVGKLKYLIVSLLYNIHIENESKQKIVFKNERKWRNRSEKTGQTKKSKHSL